MISKSPIIRFDTFCKQDRYELRRVQGFVHASGIIDLISEFLEPEFDNDEFALLEANPRDPKVGPITREIVESMKEAPQLFPFKSKGLLIACDKCEELERGRFRMTFSNSKINGILDGGHNLLAIGIRAMQMAGLGDREVRSVKRWKDLRPVWQANKEALENVKNDLGFLVSMEVIYPQENDVNANNFGHAIIQIARARNNNTQLTLEALDNKVGYFDTLKEYVDEDLAGRIEWRTNDGGVIKSRDLVALALIPLSLLPVGKDINPTVIYSSKGECVKIYERIMKTEGVCEKVGDGQYKIVDPGVRSALAITSKLPRLYDFMYEIFPDAYNKNNGKFGKLTEVKYKDGQTVDRTKYYDREVAYSYSDAYIYPWVVALRQLMKVMPDGTIKWAIDPEIFLQEKAYSLMARYKEMLELVYFNPQQVGKKAAYYANMEREYQLALKD